MGAMVEVLSAAVPTLKAFTDASGFYSLRDLVPGTYSLKNFRSVLFASTRSRVGLRKWQRRGGECHAGDSGRRVAIGILEGGSG